MVVDHLIGYIQKKNYRGKGTVLGILGDMANKRALPCLYSALEDDKKEIRLRAVEALGKIGDSNSIEPLINKTLKDKDKEVRQYTVEALGKIGDKRAEESLNAALKDVDEVVRIMATKALAKIKEKQCS